MIWSDSEDRNPCDRQLLPVPAIDEIYANLRHHVVARPPVGRYGSRGIFDRPEGPLTLFECWRLEWQRCRAHSLPVANGGGNMERSNLSVIPTYVMCTATCSFSHTEALGLNGPFINDTVRLSGQNGDTLVASSRHPSEWICSVCACKQSRGAAEAIPRGAWRVSPKIG